MTTTQHHNQRDQRSDKVRYLEKITSRKMQEVMQREIAGVPDRLEACIAHYLQPVKFRVRRAWSRGS